jgi:hypothetical protein
MTENSYQNRDPRLAERTRRFWMKLSETEREALVDQIKNMPPMVIYESAYVQKQRRLKGIGE